MSECVHCGDIDLNHNIEHSCPRIVKGYIGGWHPSNRFTPPPPAENPLAICAIPECRELFGLHHPELRSCPRMVNGKRAGWLNTKFTPYPTGKEALQAVQASRCAECGESVSGERAFTEICARCEAGKCPAGCSPFDLAKALAGAGLVTRDGHAANDFKKASNNSCDYLATIGLVTWGFDPQGNFLREDYSTPNSFDLFLAAKECGRCSICGQQGEGFVLGKCAQCSVQSPDLDSSPTPETEARRSDASDLCAHCKVGQVLPSGICGQCGLSSGGVLPSAPASEIDRQIEVMMASKKEDAFPERRHWLSAPDDPWEPCPRGIGRWEFNWEDYDHRIRPDPAQPRRVFVQCNETSIGYVSYTPFAVANGTDMRLAEFIELNPAVRAKLGMGGEK